MKEDKDIEEKIEEKIENIKNGKASDEEILEFVNEAKEGYKSAAKSKGIIKVMMGFLVPPNSLVHLLITFVMNVSLVLAIEGFFDLIEYNEIGNLLIAASLFTVYEFILKMFILTFAIKIAFMTMGLIFIASHVSGFLLLDFFYKGFSFVSTPSFFVFLLLFSGVRLILSRYIRSYFLR